MGADTRRKREGRSVKGERENMSIAFLRKVPLHNEEGGRER